MSCMRTREENGLKEEEEEEEEMEGCCEKEWVGRVGSIALMRLMTFEEVGPTTHPPSPLRLEKENEKE